MNQKHEYSNQPLVCQIAEHNQEYWESMMKSILEKVTFASDENVTKEPTEMFPTLANIEYFHLKCSFSDMGIVFNHRKGMS